MKIVLLTGLVSIEKVNLTIELARHFVAEGRPVTIIDNIARLPITINDLKIKRKFRTKSIIKTEIYEIIKSLSADDIVLIALSETMSPTKIPDFVGDMYSQIPDVNVTILTLIDTRTCDCFPTVREILESNADLIVNIPFEFSELVKAL